MKPLIFIAALLLSFSRVAQTPSQLSSVVGTVVAVEKAAKTVSMKTDQNVTLAIISSDSTVYLRVPAGAQSLDKATPILFDDIAVGDRVLARGTRSEDNFAALRIVVLSKDDVAKRRERDLEQWRTRGIAGVVKGLNAATSEINLELRGTAPGSLLAVNASASDFRRYTTTLPITSFRERSRISAVWRGIAVRCCFNNSACRQRTFDSAAVARRS